MQSQLDVQGAVYDTAGSLEDLGAKGETAMGRVEQGAQKVSGALREVKQASDEAGSGVERVAEGADAAGKSMSSASSAAGGLSLNMGEVSERTRELLSQMSGPNGLQQFANVWNALFEQRQDLAKYTEEQKKVLDGMEEISGKRKELSERFDLVGSSELDAIVQLESQIESKRLEKERAAKLAAEERRRAAQADAEAQAKADAARIQAGDNKEQVLTIDWKAPSKEVVAGATAAEIQQAERIAGLVAPIVLRRIERSRAVSVRGAR